MLPTWGQRKHVSLRLLSISQCFQGEPLEVKNPQALSVFQVFSTEVPLFLFLCCVASLDFEGFSLWRYNTVSVEDLTLLSCSLLWSMCRGSRGHLHCHRKGYFSMYVSWLAKSLIPNSYPSTSHPSCFTVKALDEDTIQSQVLYVIAVVWWDILHVGCRVLPEFWHSNSWLCPCALSPSMYEVLISRENSVRRPYGWGAKAACRKGVPCSTFRPLTAARFFRHSVSGTRIHGMQMGSNLIKVLMAFVLFTWKHDMVHRCRSVAGEQQVHCDRGGDWRSSTLS